MAQRSRIALLSRAMDVVFGNTTGTRDEQGWARGSWREQNTNNGKTAVCLNSALFVAERGVFGTPDTYWEGDSEMGSDSNTGMKTQEGLQAQRLLAETIQEMFPDMASIYGEAPQSTIIRFNDEYGDAASMEAVFRKTEDKAYAKWLEDHPQFQKASEVDQTFIDYAVTGSPS